MDEPAGRAGFEETFFPHLPAAYNLARWLTRNGHDADDVVQEAYLRAFRSFSGFRGGDGRAWFLTIVRNTCLTWLQRNRPPRPTVCTTNKLQTCTATSPLTSPACGCACTYCSG